VKFVRGTACTYGLSISIELIGAPDTAEMEKHARICNELYAPLPNENTQSRARFMAKERELISAGARTAELGLERMSLYVAAYGSAWKSVDLHAIAGSAWTQGCNDAVLAASGKAPPPAKLRETCESSTKVDLFSPAIDFVIVESGQER
jgi:hypothetical protein